MINKQCWFRQHRIITLVLVTLLLILTAIPALAANDPGWPADQPIRCCVVVPGDQGLYTGDCFGPGSLPRLPLFGADLQDLKLTRSKDKE